VELPTGGHTERGATSSSLLGGNRKDGSREPHVCRECREGVMIVVISVAREWTGKN